MSNEPLSQRSALAHLTSDLAVWDRYAVLLGTNDQSGDARISLHAAPICPCGSAGHADNTEYIYIQTNGGPSLVGWISDDGQTVELAEEDPYTSGGAAIVEAEPWIRRALDEAGLDLPSEPD